MKIKITLILLLLASMCQAQQTLGLFSKKPASFDGYVLFAPIASDTTYLIDKCGKKVHQWWSPYTPGLSVYLQPDGSLLRTGDVPTPTFNAGGSYGGIIERYDWNNNLVWSYLMSDTNETQNHDIHVMPNGNILVAVWERIPLPDAVQAGRNPASIGVLNCIWSPKVEEIRPQGLHGATIMWEWRLWDHLIQDFDSSKDNYGVVGKHPELVSVNVSSPDAIPVDWMHLNSVDYNPALDEILLSMHSISEIYIIDHSTTTAQAAAHSGGVRKRGGDLLFRWGNPQVYRRGTAADRKFFHQHDARWIPPGFRDSGKIMVFNNGFGRPTANYSSVDIIAPVYDTMGNYSIAMGAPFLPNKLDWTYVSNDSFFSTNLGGAQRLSNGNTLITDAKHGNTIEIDTTNDVVWHYVNPVGANGPYAQSITPIDNQVYKSIFYEPGYSGFAGLTIIPENPIELNPIPYNCTATTDPPPPVNTAVTAIGPDEGIRIYPNPATSQLNISLAVKQSFKVVLTNAFGQVVYAADHTSAANTASIDLKGFASGIYSLQLQGGQQTFTRKVVIAK